MPGTGFDDLAKSVQDMKLRSRLAHALDSLEAHAELAGYFSVGYAESVDAAHQIPRLARSLESLEVPVGHGPSMQ